MMSDRSDKLKLLWAFMPGQRVRYFGAIAAMLLATLVGYVVPLIAAAVINFVVQAKPLTGPSWLLDVVAMMGGRPMLARNLWIAAVAIVVLTGLVGMLNYFKSRWSAQASEAITQKLRDRLYSHLQHLPCSYHDRTDTGDLVQRCTSDVDTVRSFLAVQVVEIARAILMVVTVLPFMLALNARLTLLAMALFPVIIGFSVIFLSRVTHAFKTSDEAEGKMTTVLQENLTGIRVVRAFARQDFECGKFAAANTTYRDTTVHLIKLMAWYWSASDYTCHLQNALVLVMGGFWVMQGSADVGTLFAFIAYESMLLWPVRQMGRQLTEMGKATVSMGRLQEILRHPAEDGLPAIEARLAPAIGCVRGQDAHATINATAHNLQGAISFRDLSFSYDGKRHALQGVTFDAPAGQTLAILGPSGSGKSTLVQLLLRLYEYEHGSITIDGRELRSMDRDFVRGQMGVVLQEPFLYSKSLQDNISLGASHGDGAVVEAAQAAAIHESIVSFEKGYETLVGERGVTLSGGQRQRVALARAILKKPAILILDDALSAVDTRTESVILSALRHRRGRQTTLVIAHRLSTLMQADRVIVLDHGVVVQVGDHQSLIAEEGLYSRLWKIQSAMEDDLREEFQADGHARCADA
jgi:ATP-binding cassette subfamily B protein